MTSACLNSSSSTMTSSRIGVLPVLHRWLEAYAFERRSHCALHLGKHASCSSPCSWSNHTLCSSLSSSAAITLCAALYLSAAITLCAALPAPGAITLCAALYSSAAITLCADLPAPGAITLCAAPPPFLKSHKVQRALLL